MHSGSVHPAEIAFRELGSRVLHLWKRANFENSAFPEIAERSLREAALCNQLNADDILKWAAVNSSTQDAHQFEPGFGDFQYVAYKHNRFYIEILFWLSSTTSIHDHAFSGAFTVFQGSSIQARYRFDQSRQINQNLRIGELVMLDVDFLQTGDVVSIESGCGLIHSLFHLEHPSISVVVRTVQDDESMPQLDYCGDRVGYKNYLPIPDAKALSALRLLARSGSDEPWDFICETVQAMSLDQKFWFLKTLFFELSNASDDVFRRVQSAIGPDWAELYQPIATEACLHSITRLREGVRSASARRLVALILAVSRIDLFFRLTREHFGRDLKSAYHELLFEAEGSLWSESELVGLSQSLAELHADHSVLQQLVNLDSPLNPLWQLILSRLKPTESVATR